MNSLPPNERGAGAGMAATFQNSAMVLSIGIFFTLIILGLSSSLPHTLYQGLVTQGVPVTAATRISHLPAVGSLFASFLGYNPIASLLGPVLPTLSHAQQAYLTGRAFFPHLISGPFMDGLQGGLRLRSRRLRPGRDRQPAARRSLHPRRAAVDRGHVRGVERDHIRRSAIGRGARRGGQQRGRRVGSWPLHELGRGRTTN